MRRDVGLAAVAAVRIPSANGLRIPPPLMKITTRALLVALGATRRGCPALGEVGGP